MASGRVANGSCRLNCRYIENVSVSFSYSGRTLIGLWSKGLSSKELWACCVIPWSIECIPTMLSGKTELS